MGLKPCRRCGSKHIEMHGTETGESPWIFCRACGLVFDCRDATGRVIPSVDRLVEHWNRRADDA